MITSQVLQRTLRGHKPARPAPRMANTTRHHAVLAARLTPRDKWILPMLLEHRVLTSHQITALAFPSFRSGRQRLRELYLWSVLDRFQPFITIGTAPMHYVLAPAGAAVLAAEHGVEVKDLGYRHDRAFRIAHSLRLAHTVGVNNWFTALVATARHSNKGATVAAWWSEARCARHFGDLVRPDAYGRWTTGDRDIEFFLEYDTGTENLARLAAKLDGYAALAAATGITTPLLMWLPTARREAAARRALIPAWQQLDDPRTVPVATATPDLLNPDTAHPSPANPVWLPLEPADVTRRAPHTLHAVWQHIPPPDVGTSTATEATTPGALPPPNPMPPIATGT